MKLKELEKYNELDDGIRQNVDHVVSTHYDLGILLISLGIAIIGWEIYLDVNPEIAGIYFILAGAFNMYFADYEAVVGISE